MCEKFFNQKDSWSNWKQKQKQISMINKELNMVRFC